MFDGVKKPSLPKDRVVVLIFYLVVSSIFKTPKVFVSDLKQNIIMKSATIYYKLSLITIQQFGPLLSTRQIPFK